MQFSFLDGKKFPMEKFHRVRRRELRAVLMFKSPYQSCPIDLSEIYHSGFVKIYDLTCATVPVGYAFAAPGSMDIRCRPNMLTFKLKGENAPPTPKLAFSGRNFSMYVDTDGNCATMIMDKARLIDVSQAN